jgi:hypothetical protein
VQAVKVKSKATRSSSHDVITFHWEQHDKSASKRGELKEYLAATIPA